MLIALVGTAAVAAIALLTLLWIGHTREIALPAPTGPFTVARTTDVWRDDARELVVWIWYPAVRSPVATPADYVPEHWRHALNERRSALFALLTRDPALVHPHSIVGAPVSPDQANYPVVILRGGLGALTTDYTTLAEDLASHGYIVVGFDAPGRTSIVVFPDGRVATRPPSENPETLTGDAQRRLAERLLAAWVGDVRFVVDRLAELNASAASTFRGRLNLRALGAVGHSLGGATAAQFCHVDARCRAAIDVDGLPLGSVVQEGIDKPLMFMLSDHSGETDPDSDRTREDIRSIYGRMPPDRRVFITIRGANHFSFSDQMVVRNQVVMKVLQAAGLLRVAPRRGLGVAAEYIHRFFDVYLKGAPTNLLEGPSPEYPEVQFSVPQ